MSNNLSKQLCELCGIESKQFTKDFKTREKAASFGRKITGIPKFRCNKFDIGSYTDNKSIYQVHWKEFPDFTNPENFVRLLEIIHDNTSMGAFLICNLSYCYPFVEDFLRVLNKFLNGKMEYSKSFINDIKQSIREAEWVYE